MTAFLGILSYFLTMQSSVGRLIVAARSASGEACAHELVKQAGSNSSSSSVSEDVVGLACFMIHMCACGHVRVGMKKTGHGLN